MYKLLLVVVAVAGPAAAGTILANTVNAQTPVYTGSLIANGAQPYQWIAIGWTMGANAYTFTQADVLLNSVGFAPRNTGTFTGSLWSDNGGVPGTEITQLTPSNASPRAAAAPVTFTSLTTLTLAANTTYWLMITPQYPTFQLYAGSSALTGPGATYLRTVQGYSQNLPYGGNPTVSTGGAPYLVLLGETAGAAGSGAVPEPGSWVLVGVGLGVAMGWRARRG